MAAVAAGRWSHSSAIASASHVVALIWAGSLLLWVTGAGEPRFALLDLFALLYFYACWAKPDGRHRQFHFLLMCSYLASTGFFVWRTAMESVAPGAFAISPGWHHVISNLLFAAELALIIGYTFLYRRAQAGDRDVKADLESMSAKASRLGARLGRLLSGKR